MSIRSKFLKRTITSKQYDSKNGPLTLKSSLKKRQAKIPEYLNSMAVEENPDPKFSYETDFEDHKEIGGLDSQFYLLDFNEDSKELNPYSHDLIARSSKKNPCCFCKNFRYFLQEQQLSSARSYSLNSKDTKFLNNNNKQASPLPFKHYSYKYQFISRIDWFDNHAIPQYILGISTLMPDSKGYPELNVGCEKFSRITCTCLICDKTEKKVNEQIINYNRTKKKCSCCGVQVKDFLYPE